MANYQLQHTGKDVDNGITRALKLSSSGKAPDAAKLGGKAPTYYMSPVNLLDNSDFRNPVNQRGLDSYTVYGQKYTIDRWRTYGTITLHDGYISFVNTSADNATIYLYQLFTVGTLKIGSTYTAVCMLEDGTICAGSGVAKDNTWVTLYTHAGSLFTMRIRANADETDQFIFGTSKTGTTVNIVWCALYEGDYASDPPMYAPKGYAHELLTCQRYYYDASGYTAHLGYKSTIAYAFITLPTKMRITPTISVASDEIVVRGANDAEGNTTVVSVDSISYETFGNHIRLLFTGDGKTNHQPLVAITKGLRISADF